MQIADPRRSGLPACAAVRSRLGFVLRLVLGLVVAPGVCAFAVLPARAQSDVRIDIQSDQARKIRLLAESFQSAGDRGPARQAAVQADPILANDLELSSLFAVARAWDPGGKYALDVQAVVSGKITVRGAVITLEGQIQDFPARRLIGRSEYRGSLSDLRRLVHRFADDVAFHLTGEAGIAQTRIAYVATNGRTRELWVADYDGYNPHPLTAFKSLLASPSWAPDGHEILFASPRVNGWQVYGVPGQGGQARQVTNSGSLNIAPAWAPDGRSFAFASNREGNSEIYVAGSDGGGVRRLTVNHAIDTSPAWAPNGQQIAFTSDRSGSAQVYVMDADGGNPRRLNFEFGYTDSPDWSPRGDRIAFVVRTGGGFDIYVASADGTGARPIVTGGSNENPRWSPDGRQLVFSSDRGGRRGVWVTDLRGQTVRPLALPGGAAANPAWSPRPSYGAVVGATVGSTAHPSEGR